MEELIKRAMDIAVEPFDKNRSEDLPSLRSIAAEMGTTVIRERKLLIPAGYFMSSTSTAVQRMSAEGKTVDEIWAELKLKPSAVYAYMPYNTRPYKLDQT